ncbi:MAG: hypothetical protein HY549_07355 [Elusimicrobia bacterium]|nr:hypothetical protein [Elusimicrobiota bacterium]
MRKKGATALELLLGLSVAATMSLFIMGLFKAGLSTYQDTMRQLGVLSRSRATLAGGNRSQGLVSALQQGRGVLGLEKTRLELRPASGPALSFFQSGQALFESQWGDSIKRAEGIASLEARYYCLDDSGALVEAGLPEAASLVTVSLGLEGSGRRRPFFAGAGLRNFPEP